MQRLHVRRPWGEEDGWVRGGVRASRLGRLRASARAPLLRPPQIYRSGPVYTGWVSKHLIDVDDDALGAARAELGTSTIKDTVNEALRRATSARAQRIREALDVLAAADVGDREEAWR